MAAVVNQFTDKISTTYTGNGAAVTVPFGTYTGSRDAGFAVVVPAGATNQAVTIVFPVAPIQSMVMASDQVVTVKVNSTTTPVPATITLKATAGLIWASDFATTCPLTADVTVMYISNAGTVDAKVNFRALMT
jgi:hypothetical protein